MTQPTMDVRVGDRVWVRQRGGQVVMGLVENVQADIKNGEAGIDYVTNNEGHFWAYMSQVERVVHTKEG